MIHSNSVRASNVFGGLLRCDLPQGRPPTHQGVTSPVSAANSTVSIKKARCLWDISRVSSPSNPLRHTMMAGGRQEACSSSKAPDDLRTRRTKD